MMNQLTTDILCEEIPGQDGDLGVITLNRPKVLNALNHAMFMALDEQLAQWEKSSHIKAVLICAAQGRAFSAGGDIRSVYERKVSRDSSIAHFFRDEYALNTRIHHFPKPYIALLDGITMGGGAGVSIHGSHRIATERLVFAMPETGIGFYPDVGTTYYLARMPHKIGFYLGLTGAKISYADCYALGIVQEIISPDSLEKIIPTLAQVSLPDKNAVTKVLAPFSIPVPSSEIFQYKNEVESCFSKNTMEDILHALETASSEWCQKTAAVIKTKSPTSLKVTLLALQKAEKLNFDACMKMEYAIACHFVQGNDFFEGIRAAIIDKDQQPHWQPAKLTEVKMDKVEKYFLPQEFPA